MTRATEAALATYPGEYAGALREAFVAGWTAALAKPAPKYRVVCDAGRTNEPNVKPGELVRSRYSSAGAVWRVESVVQDPYYKHPVFDLHLVSLSSGRRDRRSPFGLVVVEEAGT